jgi:DNA-binding transcriptional ArsR family regulator
LTAQNVTCKFLLTGEREPTNTETRSRALTSEEQLLAVLTAVANPHRLRVIAELEGGRVHVSELARRLGMSRPLLYMHLDKLEKAGLVAGQLELSEDGKAMKYFELAPFELRLTAGTIIEALRADGDEAADAHQEQTEGSDT